MNFIHARPEGRWLVSRYDFAVFRLVVFLRLALARRRGFGPERADVMLFIDRYQSAVEIYLVSGWVALTATAYMAVTLMTLTTPPLAFLLCAPLTAVALELPMMLFGGVLRPIWNATTGSRGVNNFRVNSAVLMLILIALSWYFATGTTWARFAAWQFLGVVALNGVCAVVLLPLRESIARLEAAAGGSPSAL